MKKFKHKYWTIKTNLLKHKRTGFRYLIGASTRIKGLGFIIDTNPPRAAVKIYTKIELNLLFIYCWCVFEEKEPKYRPDE